MPWVGGDHHSQVIRGSRGGEQEGGGWVGGYVQSTNYKYVIIIIIIYINNMYKICIKI